MRHNHTQRLNPSTTNAISTYTNLLIVKHQLIHVHSTRVTRLHHIFCRLALVETTLTLITKVLRQNLTAMENEKHKTIFRQ